MAPPPARAEKEAVPILTYHSLDDSGSVISVPPAAFREHMRGLRDKGFTGIALGRLVDAWDGRGSLPPRPVVLTFDDAFRNFAEAGRPVLEAAGFAATVFAVAGRCGQTNDWPGQLARVPRLPLLSAAELRDLAAAGFEIGSHGLTHAALDGLSAQEAEREIVGSKRALEDALGRPVEVLAYPYGRTSAAIRGLAAAHYRACCGVAMAAARASHDRHALPRIDVYYLRRPGLFRTLGTPLGRGYLALRGFGRRLRARARPS
jgi:peptidoglycan/xylan/chitin deacetylase (PgdA/CDA1 family)